MQTADFRASDVEVFGKGDSCRWLAVRMRSQQERTAAVASERFEEFLLLFTSVAADGRIVKVPGRAASSRLPLLPSRPSPHMVKTAGK